MFTVDVSLWLAEIFFIQPYQFDPESDPEGEAPKEVQTLWQQHVSEWLVCLNILVCLYVLLQLLPCN